MVPRLSVGRPYGQWCHIGSGSTWGLRGHGGRGNGPSLRNAGSFLGVRGVVGDADGSCRWSCGVVIAFRGTWRRALHIFCGNGVRFVRDWFDFRGWKRGRRFRGSGLFRVVLVPIFRFAPVRAFARAFGTAVGVHFRSGSGGGFLGLCRFFRWGGNRWNPVRHSWHHGDRDGSAWKHGLFFDESRGGSGVFRCLRNREGRDGDRDKDKERGFFHEVKRQEGMKQPGRG